LRKEESRKEQQVECNCGGNKDLKYPHKAPTIVGPNMRFSAADRNEMVVLIVPILLASASRPVGRQSFPDRDLGYGRRLQEALFGQDLVFQREVLREQLP
jgi:hypothetical protein